MLTYIQTINETNELIPAVEFTYEDVEQLQYATKNTYGLDTELYRKLIKLRATLEGGV